MYRYDDREDPPAAYLSVQMTNPDTGVAIHLPAKIDSGAAMSVLPQTAVANLALEPMGDILASGYDRRATLLPTYSVTFEVEGYTFRDVEVTASPRNDVLLGRDVLNHFILTLDGKNLTFDLKDP
ncbi:MAG: retroviral-like aspartic protease family protein [Anaerolineae bacterium]